MSVCGEDGEGWAHRYTYNRGRRGTCCPAPETYQTFQEMDQPLLLDSPVSVLVEDHKRSPPPYNHSPGPTTLVSFSFELRPVVKLKIEIGARQRTPCLVLTLI